MQRWYRVRDDCATQIGKAISYPKMAVQSKRRNATWTLITGSMHKKTVYWHLTYSNIQLKPPAYLAPTACLQVTPAMLCKVIKLHDLAIKNAKELTVTVWDEHYWQMMLTESDVNDTVNVLLDLHTDLLASFNLDQFGPNSKHYIVINL